MKEINISLLTVLLLLTIFVCLCAGVGSVKVPLADLWHSLQKSVYRRGIKQPDDRIGVHYIPPAAGTFDRCRRRHAFCPYPGRSARAHEESSLRRVDAWSLSGASLGRLAAIVCPLPAGFPAFPVRIESLCFCLSAHPLAVLPAGPPAVLRQWFDVIIIDLSLLSLMLPFNEKSILSSSGPWWRLLRLSKLFLVLITFLVFEYIWPWCGVECFSGKTRHATGLNLQRSASALCLHFFSIGMQWLWQYHCLDKSHMARWLIGLTLRNYYPWYLSGRHLFTPGRSHRPDHLPAGGITHRDHHIDHRYLILCIYLYEK